MEMVNRFSFCLGPPLLTQPPPPTALHSDTSQGYIHFSKLDMAHKASSAPSTGEFVLDIQTNGSAFLKFV